MSEATHRIESILNEAARAHRDAAGLADVIAEAAERLADVLVADGTVFAFGNGGSAADAQHLAGELVGRFLLERAALPCVALSTDSSVMTCVGNDYGFERVFLRQVEALVREGDAVIGLSTSGSSTNVVAAVDEANARGALTVGLTGGSGGLLAERCDIAIVVPSQHTPRIQEVHGTVIHILCELIEERASSGL